VSARRLIRCVVLLAAWLMATGAMGGCPFFQPTEPERPNAPPIPTNYSDPDKTLETLALGMEAKTGNGPNVYLSAFAESSAISVGDGRGYHGFFDPLDLAQDPLRDPDWNRELEPYVYNLLVQRYTLPFEMSWEPYQQGGNDVIGATESLLHRKYRIETVSRIGTTLTRTTIAVGAADLTFVKSPRNGNWVIAVWQDFHAIGEDAFVTLGLRRLNSR
jgi:hypothetical protein